VKRRAAAALALALLTGCGVSDTVTPEVALRRVSSGVLSGRVLYRGEAEYVPRTLRNRDDASAIFLYSVTTFSNRGTLPIIGELLPLGLLGLPTQSNVVTASARLEIRSANRRIAEYQATARARRFRGLYSGGSDALPELTRRAMLALRSNLDAQLINDLPALQQTLGR
jgi:hypothetical protein